MPDREKVIKGLEHCRKTSCESCPYNATDVKSSNPICLINEMLSDALALIDTQYKLILELQNLISIGTKMMNSGEVGMSEKNRLCIKREYCNDDCMTCTKAVKIELL